MFHLSNTASMYIVSILRQPSSSTSFRCSCRTLSLCQFNSHSRRGIHGERMESREVTEDGFDGKERNRRIGLAVVFSDGCKNEEIAGHVPSAVCSLLSFVRWRVIISRRTKTRYREINSALVPLSVRPFYQILP